MLERIEAFCKNYEEEVLELAQELRGQELPKLTEELFSEYERNGNRLRYEDAYFGRRKFLSVFGLASVIGRRPEDIEKLEEVLLEICGEECWALPAHVDRRRSPDWRVAIDLFAGETAQALAHLTALLGRELTCGTAEMVRREAERRVLLPFMASRPPYAGWEKGGGNWTAVCCGCIGSAGLFLLEEGEKRRSLMKRLAHALTDGYLSGFGDDGACAEGLGYWAYGMTYYLLFAEQLKRAYPDMDLLSDRRLPAVACFQQKCYFAGGRTLSFSDGDSRELYPMGLTCALAGRFEGVRFPPPESARRLGQDACWRWIGLYWDWSRTKEYLRAVRQGSVEPPGELEKTGDHVFPDVQWAVFRGAMGSAAAVKGGCNAEPHNHNDVGSFFYLADGEAFLEDLGCGEYTRGYFSEKRYEIFCNRGMGHNIPVIGGSDQRPGREYRAESFEVPKKGVAVIRFPAAYGLENLKGLERTVRLDESDGSLAVTDIAETKGKLDFWENLVTRLPVTLSRGQITIHGSRLRAVVTLWGQEGEIEQSTVFHSNHRGETERVNVLRWRAGTRQAGQYQSGFRLELFPRGG